MTAPLFLADPGSLDEASPGSTVRLGGDEARHARSVRRLRDGETVDIADGCGRRVSGVVVPSSPDALVVEVAAVHDDPAPTRRIIAIQALAKGDRGERAVETLTEVGVDVIVPWSARRSITQWTAQKAERGIAKWRSTAREAAKQSRRSRVPEIADPADLDAAVEWIAHAGAAFLLDARGEPLPDLIAEDQPDGDWLIVIGPEGGFEDEEYARFVQAGAREASLGPTVLRTSTAGTVAAGIIAAADRWSAPSGSRVDPVMTGSNS